MSPTSTGRPGDSTQGAAMDQRRASAAAGPQNRHRHRRCVRDARDGARATVMDNLAMGEPGFPLTGGCGCGAVRFEVRAQLGPALYCHCTRCQRRTGTGASVTARVESASFKIASGGHKLRAWQPDGGWEKWFCGCCGSAIYSRHPIETDRIGVRLGAFDGDPGVSRTRERDSGRPFNHLRPRPPLSIAHGRHPAECDAPDAGDDGKSRAEPSPQLQCERTTRLSGRRS